MHVYNKTQECETVILRKINGEWRAMWHIAHVMSRVLRPAINLAATR